MSNRVELLAGRRNTTAYIKSDPITISLRRPTMVESQAGGRIEGSPVTLPPQEFRITPMSGQVWDRSKTTPDEGRVSDVTQLLIGHHNADIRQNDEFDYNDGFIEGTYKVVHVSPERGYRVQATIEFQKTGP